LSFGEDPLLLPSFFARQPVRGDTMAAQSQKAKQSKSVESLPSPFNIEAKALELYNQGKPYYKPVGGILLAIILISAVANVRDDSKREHNAQAHLVIQQALALNSGEGAGTAAVYEQQRGHYNKVLKDFADTPGAIDAQFHLARVQLDSGDAVGGEAAFKEFLSKNPSHSPFSLMAKLGIANALMAQQKWADAKTQYLAVAKDPQASEAEFSAKRSLYQAGMAALLAGDTTGADEILNELRIDVEAREAKDGEDRRYTTLKDDAEDLLAKMKVYSAEDLLGFVLAPIPEPEPVIVPPVTPAPTVTPGISAPGTNPASVPRSQGPPKPAAGTTPAAPAAPEASTPAPAAVAPVATPKAATPPAATPKVAKPPAATPKVATPPAVTPKVETPPAVTPKAATPPAATPEAATPPPVAKKVATPPPAAPEK
jgi:hypothetical protein